MKKFMLALLSEKPDCSKFEFIVMFLLICMLFTDKMHTEWNTCIVWVLTFWIIFGSWVCEKLRVKLGGSKEL